ncbi:MAG TPA: hypothetical protein VMS55_11170 [Myxococcota bacterium]|nr:hypothetical protein [Myxococcota bacterium]
MMRVMIAAATLMVGVSALGFFLATRSERATGAATREPEPVNPVETELRHVTVTPHGGDEAQGHLSADRIVVRRRTAARGLLVYHDLKEIYAAGVDLATPVESSEGSLLLHVVASVRELLPLKEFRAESPAGAAARPFATPRVVFADLAIRLTRSRGEAIYLRAASGRLNSGAETLVLDRAEISMGSDALQAPRAVLSDRLDGVLLPLGYERGAEQAHAGLFLVLDDSGRFATAPRVPEFDYADAVDKTEKLVLTHLLKRAPTTLQPLLALVVGGLGSDIH